MQAVISPTAQGHFRAKHRQKLSAGAVRTKVRSPAAETQRTGGECRSAGPELILCLLGARTAAWDCERTLAPGNSERSAARASCSRCSQRPQSTTESRAARNSRASAYLSKQGQGLGAGPLQADQAVAHATRIQVCDRAPRSAELSLGSPCVKGRAGELASMVGPRPSPLLPPVMTTPRASGG
jgi:hypothetical protein